MSMMMLMLMQCSWLTCKLTLGVLQRQSDHCPWSSHHPLLGTSSTIQNMCPSAKQHGNRTLSTRRYSARLTHHKPKIKDSSRIMKAVQWGSSTLLHKSINHLGIYPIVSFSFILLKLGIITYHLDQHLYYCKQLLRYDITISQHSQNTIYHNSSVSQSLLRGQDSCQILTIQERWRLESISDQLVSYSPHKPHSLIK